MLKNVGNLQMMSCLTRMIAWLHVCEIIRSLRKLIFKSFEKVYKAVKFKKLLKTVKAFIYIWKVVFFFHAFPNKIEVMINENYWCNFY